MDSINFNLAYVTATRYTGASTAAGPQVFVIILYVYVRAVSTNPPMVLPWVCFADHGPAVGCTKVLVQAVPLKLLPWS